MVKLLETTLIRVGNKEYAKQNNSFGLTTLQDRHAKIGNGKVRFKFRGKSGVSHDIDLEDPRVAKIVKQCQDLPGAELLQYVDDDGQVRDIGSADVNEYLRAAAGDEFTAKDFRTWAGTVLAALALREVAAFDSTAPFSRPPAGTATTMPMTDLARFPNALPPIWTNNGSSQGTGPAVFLDGPQWRAWNGRLAVGVMGGTRLVILQLNAFWDRHGCALLQPYDMEMGAGTFHPATTLRALGPKRWNAAYVQPSRRPKDGRYGENPNRLQHYYQYQVVLKPSPLNIQELYLDSLKSLGIDPREHDIRFVEDNWESPALGAWGLYTKDLTLLLAALFLLPQNSRVDEIREVGPAAGRPPRVAPPVCPARRLSYLDRHLDPMAARLPGRLAGVLGFADQGVVDHGLIEDGQEVFSGSGRSNEAAHPEGE